MLVPSVSVVRPPFDGDRLQRRVVQRGQVDRVAGLEAEHGVVADRAGLLQHQRAGIVRHEADALGGGGDDCSVILPKPPTTNRPSPADDAATFTVPP